VRENWLIQVLDPALLAAHADHHEHDPEELAWSTTTYGPEDALTHAPSSYARELAAAGGAPPVSVSPASPPHAQPPPPPTPTPATLRLRTERQSLRRLPRTGAIVFTIRTYLVPVTALAREPGVPARLAAAVRGVKGTVWTCVALSFCLAVAGVAD